MLLDGKTVGFICCKSNCMEVGISDEAIENAFRREKIPKKWISKMCKKCDIFKDIIIFQILSFGFHVYFSAVEIQLVRSS